MNNSKPCFNNLEIRSEKHIFPQTPKSYLHSCLLIFSEKYDIGISNLGHQIIWQTINDRDYWICDRVYHTNKTTLTNSIELNLSVSHFDVLAFSLYYEANLIHFLDFLRSAQNSFRENKRSVIIAGGPLVDILPDLILNYVDIVFHGNAQNSLHTFLDAYETFGNSPELYKHLLPIPGISISSRIKSRFDIKNAPPKQCKSLCDSNSQYCILSPIVSPSSLFSNTALINLGEGCPHHCTFCYIGKFGKPYLPVDTKRILQSLTYIAESTDIKRVGLVSAAVGAHPDIDEICLFALEKHLELTFSSIRAEDVTDTMLSTLSISGTSTITLAPEAGSARLRKLLGKAALTDDLLFDVIKRSQIAKLSNVKLYFMIGLPTEQKDDIIAIVTLIKKCREILIANKQTPTHVGKIIVNLSVFVPKPQTPLFNLRETCPPVKVVRQSVLLLRKELMRLGGIDFRPPSFLDAEIQSALDVTPTRGKKILELLFNEGISWREALLQTKSINN